LSKTEDENELIIEQSLYAKKFVLRVDRNRCKGCGICRDICHREAREAIKLKPVPTENGEKTRPPTIDVDHEKCDYCGMCDVLCPFGAIRITINGEHIIPVIEKESFPKLIRDIKVDLEKCETGCIKCAEACPLGIIKVDPTKPLVEIDVDACPCCRLCEVACPTEAIHVRKFINGVIKINHEKCPKDCHDCFDVCPVNVMSIGDDGKVYVDESFCMYCGACVNVCPEEGALELYRISIHHTEVKSGAWNRSLEKLTSTLGVTKELKAKGLEKAKELVQKRTP